MARYHVGVFQVSPIVVVRYLLAYALTGAVIGVLSGWLATLVTKCGPRGLWKDALLGAFGYVAGFFAGVYMPWYRNTVTYRLDSGTVMTSTTNTYQHPERIAAVIAVLLPMLHEIYRDKKRERQRT